MSKAIATTIDIGSFQIKAISLHQKDDGTYNTYKVQTSLLGNKASSDTLSAVKQTLEELERKSKKSIESIYVAFQDPAMTSTKVVLTKKYKTPTTITLDETLNIEEKIHNKVALESPNQHAIYTRVVMYSIDGVEQLDPINIEAKSSITATYFFVLIPNHICDKTLSIFSTLGIDVVDYLPSPIASGYFGLTDHQKEAGTVVIDMGFKHTSIVVYDDHIPLHLSVMKSGVYDILKEIAIKRKVSLAEIIDEEMHHTQSNKEITTITAQLLKKYFQTINQRLSKTGKEHLLAGGVFLCGGGSYLHGVANIAKETLKLPIIRSPREGDSMQKKKEFSVVLGLSTYAVTKNSADVSVLGTMFSTFFSSIKRILRSVYNNIS